MIVLCPYCGGTERQVKAGRNGDRQRYKCGLCQRRYTPSLQARGYPESVRRQAALLRAQGLPVRQIARRIVVNHQSVASWLRRQESDAVASPPPTEAGRRRPTIGDVAQRAGVSVASVSNFLNQKGRMSDATRSRIQAAMEELNFTPSALVRAIRHRRTAILGVLIPGLGGLDESDGLALTPPLLRGIHDGADAARHDLLLYTGWPHRDRGDLSPRFLDGHIDGLLWMAPAMSDPTLTRVVSAGLPVVALLTRHVPEGVGYVNPENFGAMLMLVTHLAERGHRRIAFIGPDLFSNFLDRHTGYRRAMEALSLPWDPAFQVTLRWRDCGSDAVGRALDSWRALPDPPTAIMCATDRLAATLAGVARARGLRIPGDVALTGFDDDAAAEHIADGLTTVRQPYRRMGQMAAEALLALIEGKPVADHRLTVPTEIIVRSSTGG